MEWIILRSPHGRGHVPEVRRRRAGRWTRRMTTMLGGETAQRRFSFGLWTVMNRGADPFGAPTRSPLDPLPAISGLAAHGAHAFELHAEDLIPPGSSLPERDRLIRAARRRMEDTGIVCVACGSDVFSDPIFKDGGLVSNEARVRRQAIARYMAAIDVGHLLGAPLFNIWGGRGGGGGAGGAAPRSTP